MQIVKTARRHFPKLKLLVRARSRSDAFEYHDLHVPFVRETFGSGAGALPKHILEPVFQKDGA